MNKTGIKKFNNIVDKPWGKFYNLAGHEGKWHLKILFVEKGHRLSLQKHVKRSEFWIVVEGRVRVQKNGRWRRLTSQKTVFIKKRELHRLEALSDAVVVEVSFGEYRENDIKRIIDDYNRV